MNGMKKTTAPTDTNIQQKETTHKENERNREMTQKTKRHEIDAEINHHCTI